MKLNIIVILSLIIGFSACKTKKMTIVDPREDLISAITDAIHLLENKETQTFIEKYALPEDLEKILKKKSMSELVEDFSKGKGEKVLIALRLAKKLKPMYSESGNKASFLKSEVGGLSKDLVFTKFDNLWYLAN